MISKIGPYLGKVIKSFPYIAILFSKPVLLSLLFERDLTGIDNESLFNKNWFIY